MLTNFYCVQYVMRICMECSVLYIGRCIFFVCLLKKTEVATALSCREKEWQKTFFFLDLGDGKKRCWNNYPCEIVGRVSRAMVWVTGEEAVQGRPAEKGKRECDLRAAHWTPELSQEFTVASTVLAGSTILWQKDYKYTLMEFRGTG